MITMKSLKYTALAIISFILFLVAGNAHAENAQTAGTSLPFAIFIEALLETPEYDERADYTKLNTTKIPFSQYIFKNDSVDKVVVQKSTYRLFLYRKGKLVKSYYIALGENPKGHKHFEGDKKTPEGTYILDYINPNSRFHKSFHISYPNKTDIDYAKSMGKKPGGMIMVHGQPYVKDNPTPGLQSSNWTNGCIALLNDDMDEFIELVSPGTVIEIKP